MHKSGGGIGLGLSRRAFVAGMGVCAASLALGGCTAARDEPPAPAANEAGADGRDAPTDQTASPIGLIDGGTFRHYLDDPVSIDPYNVQEHEGMLVCNALFDTLTAFDYEKRAIVGKAATSWEANEDATEFTFHIREGMAFHNGDPVTAKDFAFSWNRLCGAWGEPAPSPVSYHLAMIDGYDDLVRGRAGSTLGVACPDDYTLVVTLGSSYADFPYVVSHFATAPVPESAVDDAATFSRSPIGNGPFKMDGEWIPGERIRLVRNENYWGDPAHVDSVEFSIQRDPNMAYDEFLAGNLDCTQIPDGRIGASVDEFGLSPDGYTANPGQQVLLGNETSVCYLTCNNNDELLGNVHLRKAISMAIDRQAICDMVLEGAGIAADNFVTPDIDGYEKGAWEGSRYDLEAARGELRRALGELGADQVALRLAYNAGGGREALVERIRDDLAELGISVELEPYDWATYLDKLQAGDYQVGCLDWVADYPIMDNFLYPLFFTGTGDNLSGFCDPSVDSALVRARAVIGDAARARAMQQVNAMVAEKLPVVPLLFRCHDLVTSDRVNGLQVNPMRLVDFSKCWLSA